MAGTPEDKRLTTFVVYGGLALIAWLAWLIVRPFAVEATWAVVLAITLDPLRAWLAPRLGRTRTATVVTAMVLLLVMVPGLALAYVLFRDGAAAAGYLRALVVVLGGASGALHRLWEWAHVRDPQLPAEQVIVSNVESSALTIAEFVGVRAGSLLASAGGLLLSGGLVLMLLFLLVRDASSFADGFRDALPFSRERNVRIVRAASELVAASVTSTLVIAAIQGVIGGIAFALLGVPGASVWGAMIGLFALLPLVGAAPVWAPAAAWLALTGHVVQGAIIAAVGLLVLGNVASLGRPLLLSGKSRLSAPVLFFSLMGGVSAFGFIGIVLGPLVAAVLSAIIGSYERGAAIQSEARNSVEGT